MDEVINDVNTDPEIKIIKILKPMALVQGSVPFDLKCVSEDGPQNYFCSEENFNNQSLF